MSSTSRPQTTGTSNIQPGQSPSKPSQVESTNPPPNVAQPLYQNNPNQQFIPNNIPLINPAQQRQFQTQLSANIQQTAAFLQRQSQLMQQQQQQQQQQPNSVESQMKNQPLNNGPLASFPNLPELLNFFLLSNSNLNIPLPQLNPTQTSVQQQPLQTPKTVPVSPSKSGQSQHTPRSATSGPRSVSANISNAQTAELNSATSVTPTVSEQNTEIPKHASSPIKSSSTSTASTPSSVSEVLLEEVRERTNILLQGAKKKAHDDNAALSSNTAPLNSDTVQDIVSSPETSKPTLPRRKQTNVTGTTPIKANPIISPSKPTVLHDSLTFSTPKKSVDVKSSSNSPSTPAASVSAISLPTSADKKVKPTKKEVSVQKSPKKNQVEPKPAATTVDQKSATTSAQAAPSRPTPETIESEIKSKRSRVKTNLYQSPTPELVLATRMSVSEANKNSVSSKDKLIIFYADEFIAVRNDEGSFFLCQCGHNMYRTSKKCRVRWLNKDDNSDDTYKLTFYDHIDRECILTSVSLDTVEDNSYKLTVNERERIDNILKKSIDVEKGILPRPEVTEENPDGLDISLYKNESQITTEDAVSHKRKSEGSSKSMSPAKKVKQNTKISENPPPNRRKNISLSVESPKKTNKSSKQSKKTVQRRSNELKKVSAASSPSEESSTDAGEKKVAKTKTQKKSSTSSTASSSVGSERTLRKRN